MSILSDTETKKAHRKALEEIDRLKQAVSIGMAREIVVMQRRLTEEALDAWEEERRDPWAESEEA